MTGGGELVLVTDRVTADLFQTTSGGTATTLNFANAASAYNDATLAPQAVRRSACTPGSPPTVAAKARFVRYFIDNVTDPDHPTLMVDRLTTRDRAPQPVADDIEDMQLSYGLDTNNDGVVDTFRCGEGETAIFSAGQIPQIRQVRLHLVARSRIPESGLDRQRGPRPRTGRRPRRPTGTEGGSSK